MSDTLTYKQQWNRDHQERVKEYNHKLIDNGYYKAYYHAHLKEKVQCTCGHTVSKGNMSRHLKSPTHARITAFHASKPQDTAHT